MNFKKFSEKNTQTFKVIKSKDDEFISLSKDNGICFYLKCIKIRNNWSLKFIYNDNYYLNFILNNNYLFNFSLKYFIEIYKPKYMSLYIQDVTKKYLNFWKTLKIEKYKWISKYVYKNEKVLDFKFIG